MSECSHMPTPPFSYPTHATQSRADGMEPSPVDTLLAGKFSSFAQQEYRKGVKADMSIRRQIEVLNIMGNSLVIN